MFFVDKEDIEERREVTTSIMPTGLLDALSANEIRHLLAFLLSDKKPQSRTIGKTSSVPAPDNAKQQERIGAIADTEGSVLLDFANKELLAGNRTSHKATVTQVKDAPEGSGEFAAKTVVDAVADANTFFGTSFTLPVTDLSKSRELSIWIKTDIESGFNLQIHSGTSGNSGVSVFPFNTFGSQGKWKKITAPIARFRKPPWAKSEADITKIRKIQTTAFSSGPYDGKYIMLCNIRRTGTPARGGMIKDGEESPSYDGERAAILQERAARLHDPKIIKRGELVDMFDGKTLSGWITSPRVYVPRTETFDNMPADRLYDEVIKFYEENEGGRRIPNRERVRNRGVWEIKDGAVIGGQVPGSIAGSYLISEKTYGDFELTLEANPDFPIDTGIMVRAHRLGSVGYQVLIDNRPNGSIGGVYGNSVGSFLAWPFTIDGDEEPGNKIANIREGVVESNPLRGGKFKSDYSGKFEDFQKAWKPNDWNKIKVRCTGRLPLIETWVNDVLVSRLDTATLSDVVPNYDAEAIFNRIGRKGHIAFEVHDSPTRQRWAPGAKCRWRNVRIRELLCEETKDVSKQTTTTR